MSKKRQAGPYPYGGSWPDTGPNCAAAAAGGGAVGEPKGDGGVLKRFPKIDVNKSTAG
jgi:hypothetical protein